MLYLGLLGENIQHSKSQSIYEELLNKKIEYKLFDLEKAVPDLNYYFDIVDGLSITSPHKEALLDSVIIEDDEILKLNAINCIRKKNNKFFATNTDYFALRKILKKYINWDVCILGNGVMSKLICTIMDNNLQDYILFTGKCLREKKYIDLTKISRHSNKRVIFNCCSRSFIFKGIFDKNDLLYDLNYSFNEHRKIANEQSIIYIDGLELLQLQAKFALKFWGIS